MKRRKSEDKILDLIHNDLSAREKEIIESQLENEGIGNEDIEAIRFVEKLTGVYTETEPSERMDKRFYAMLEEEQKNALLGEPEKDLTRHYFSSHIITGFKIAAGISLFLLGWFAAGWVGSGSNSNPQLLTLSREVRQLKETLVLTMMQQNSSIERIKAVTMVSEFEKPDVSLIDGLMNILNNDDNVNVRLLALDELNMYSALPEVRSGLISSIDNQSSPMVQLRLAEIMLNLNEKRAVPEFQKVLLDANLNYRVRRKMNEALVVLL